MKGIINIKSVLILTVAFVLVSMSVFAVITLDSVKATNYESPMYAGNAKNEDECGSVTVVHIGATNSKYTVTYKTSGNWVITETHLHVATSYDDIPQTKSGNPKIGKFDYSSSDDPGVTTVTYDLDFNDLMDMTFTETGWRYTGTLYFASHSVVYNTVEDREETSWADSGENFEGNSWAMYFTVTLPPS